MNKVEKMYEAIHEVVCAFVLHQEAIEKARESKKSVMKAYNEMNNDLDMAFRNCLDTIEEIKNSYPEDIKEFLQETAQLYEFESSVHTQVIETFEKEKETASVLKKKNLDAQIKAHQRNLGFCMSRVAKAKSFAELV